jgi:glycerol-3-phosphate acyltransferase PlsY
MYGFLFGMALIGGYSFWIFFLPLVTFLVILYIGKIVALASVGSAIINTIYIYFALDSFEMFLASLLFTIFMTVRHRKNFERILKGEENKISWM